jgi:hypothetical protein
MKSPHQRIGTLLGLSAVLAAVLAFEIMAGPFFVPDAPSVSPGTKSIVMSENRPAVVRPPISTFDEIVKRPLFFMTRRPAPPKAAAKVAEEQPKSETFDLVGVVISPDGRMALLRTIATKEVLRAVEGQNVGGWEVHAIKPTQVVLQQGDNSEVLKISDAAAPPAANGMSAPRPPNASVTANASPTPNAPPPPSAPPPPASVSTPIVPGIPGVE